MHQEPRPFLWTLNQDSTAIFIRHLSDGVKGGSLPHPVEQLVLRRLVDQFMCPLCQAVPGLMCYTYGAQNLRRTHLPRLRLASPREVRLAIRWALAEYARQSEDPN